MDRAIPRVVMSQSQETFSKSDYERSDVSASLLVWLSGGLALFLLLVPFLLASIYSDTIRQAHVAPVPMPPAPRLQVDPSADLAAFRAGEAAELSSYGWEDRAAAVVRIPVDRAMALTAERGLPDWPKP
jgi:hypothetical protein